MTDAHRLTSSEIGSPGAIWKPACGFCRSTIPGGDAGIRVRATTATRKPRRAQDFGGAIAVDADQIGHHVAGAAIAAVDEQRDLARGALGRRLCATTTSGAIRPAIGFRHSAVSVKPSCGSRESAPCVRSRRSSAGTVVARWTRAQPHPDAALASRDRARGGFLRQHAAGRNLRIGPPRVVHFQRRAPGRTASAVASFDGPVGEVGNLTSRARNAIRIEAAANTT